MEKIRMSRSVLLAVLWLLLLLILVTVTGAAGQPGTGPEIWGAQLHLAGADFGTGSGSDYVVNSAGLTLAAPAATATYLSPPLSAARPFNVYVPSWEASLPAGAELQLSVRTRADEGAWSAWQPIAENHDWTLPTDDDVVGQMVMVGAADVVHTTLQFQVVLVRSSSMAAPRLDSITFSVIDSTQGPDSVPTGFGEEGDGYPKPPVVGRDQWCTYSDCNYTDGLAYEPVTHLLVHHTVTSNCTSNCDWEATVRAIWYFHTYDRGWGDIGYNYLVDQDGVIYEGHLGGDDVIGTHASGANAGSMGVALIGTFTESTHSIPGIPPPQIMVDALVELLAWKADQKDIDVYDASGLPNLGWGLINLVGHRDVYGTTTCPGDQAHDIIPAIRDAVAAKLNFAPPHLYIDELSSAFTSSGGLWEGPNQCGFNVHAYYTNSTTGSAGFWGRWRPNFPQTGRYEVSVFAPYCLTGYSDTQGATYQVNFAGGVDTVVIDQGNNLGFWQVLGNYDFNAGTGGSIYLTNQTTTDSGLGMWFDAIRFRFLDTTNVNNLLPADNTWQTNANINFSWQYGDAGAVSNATLEVATDAAFANIIYSTNLNGATQSHGHTFTQDYANLYWHVAATTFGQETVFSPVWRFGLDTQPPVSAISAINLLPDGTYVVNWTGSDATAGIVGYNIDVQAAGGAWTPLLTNTTAPSIFFVPPVPGTTYWFRSQAIDAAGHVEALHTSGDLSTDDAPLLDHAIMFPIVPKR